MFKFAPADLLSHDTLCAVKTLTNADGVSTVGKVMTLFHYFGKNFEHKGVLRIIDGNNVGAGVDRVITDVNLKYLPCTETLFEGPARYELVYDPVIAKNKVCYQVFVGSLDDVDQGKHMTIYDRDDIMRTVNYELEKDPSIKYAAVYVFELGKEVYYHSIYHKKE